MSRLYYRTGRELAVGDKVQVDREGQALLVGAKGSVVDAHIDGKVLVGLTGGVGAAWIDITALAPR